MNNVLAFLEMMGRDPSIARMAPEQLREAMAEFGIDDAPQQALASRDAGSLNDLLGGRPTMMCMLFPAEGDEDKKKDDDQGDGEQPGDNDQKESIRRNGRH